LPEISNPTFRWN